MSKIKSPIPLLKVWKMNIPALSRNVKEEKDSSDEDKTKNKIYISFSNISSPESRKIIEKDYVDIGIINVFIFNDNIIFKDINF